MADECRALTPVALNFDVNLQEDLHAKQFFQLFASGGTDFFEHCAAATNDDGFLAVAIDVDRGTNADEARAFVKGVHQNGDGVRNFLTGKREDFFAKEFGDKETLGLIGEEVVWEIRLAFREMGDEVVQEASQAIASQRGNGNDFSKVRFAGERVDEGKELRFGDKVNLVEKKKAMTFEAAGAVESSSVVGGERLSGVKKYGEKVDTVESQLDLLHHLATEGRFGAMKARSVDENDLRAGSIDDALNPIAGGLGARRDDGDFAANQLVDQGGLARVWAAQKCDEAGFEAHMLLTSYNGSFNTEVTEEQS